MSGADKEVAQLPEDAEALKALVRSLLIERNREQRRADEQQRNAEQQQRNAEQQQRNAERQQRNAEQQQRNAERQQRNADEQKRRADELHIVNLRLQLELERYKKWYYGPRADRLQSSGELAQLLLDFAEELDRQPVAPDDVAARG